MDSIVKFDNVSVVYDAGKSNEVWALKNVSFEIYPQEYIIFFGPSGCGKSTLLYVIAGLEYPSQGKVIVKGKNLKNLTPRQLIEFHRSTIGMVFQAYYLLPHLDVEDNILLPQLFSGASSPERNKKAELLMKKFGIWNLRKRNISQLSGGQQQRVAIARALINGADIILADELTGNLDSKNSEIVLNLLEDLHKNDQKTIIQVTHNPNNLHRANRIFYMKDGRIIREVVNTNKEPIANISSRKVSELEKLAKAYPYLTETRLRAKLILNNLLMPVDIDTQQKIEEIIERYIKGKINDSDLVQLLDISSKRGGANLYKQRAQSLAKKVIDLVHQMKVIEHNDNSQRTSVSEKVIKIRQYLLDNANINLSLEQVKRIDNFLTKRIIGEINKYDIAKLFDLSFKKGGVGLNRRTALKFSKEIELLLLDKTI